MPIDVPAHPLLAHLRMLARYGRWATRQLFDSVDRLPHEAYRRDVGLFFKSVHGTLNHLLVTEHLLWWHRFADGASPVLALNAEAEPDRARLRERLLDGAAAWGPWLDTLAAARLDATLDYVSTEGKALSMPFAPTLAHVFNHGTHHRGQVSAALTMLGERAPVLDLLFMLRQEAASR
jgi:uncharacterized damage-inducible protein DinB